MIKTLFMLHVKLIVPFVMFWLMGTVQSLAVNSGMKTVCISDLMEGHVLGEHVQLEGRIVAEINYETVLFEDATGQIEVLVGEDDLIPSRVIDPTFYLRLKGEVESGYRGNPLIHFQSVEILSRDEVISLSSFDAVSQTSPDTGNNGAKAKTSKISFNKPKTDLSDSMTVSEILESASPGMQVTLYGHFVKEVNYETLLFRDATGEIEVIFAEDDFQPTNWSESMKLTGELDVDYEDNVKLRFGDLERLPVGGYPLPCLLYGPPDEGGPCRAFLTSSHHASPAKASK
ncbi:MAG: NirD/YgiW/YdeI family stress tolerance protein [Deltaproteobacteria bacterium]|jgi:uncharacterized protein YdeI (BOF family)|nr:NirD/YgiW/YdeI family stress tolerance protein [Deltaproteobacteria bacterium]